MLRALNTDTATAGSIQHRPEEESKLNQALRLLQECGFKAIFMDLHAGHNRSAKTAVICPQRGSPASKTENHMSMHLPALTPQQTEVLKSIAEAKPNKRIAFELGITETTVKAHVTNIYRKLGVRNRSEAIVLMQALHASEHSGHLNRERVLAV
jgi:DNA-binding NarL/FixJ family response regulator